MQVNKNEEDDSGNKRRRRGSSLASALKFKMFGTTTEEEEIEEEPEPSCLTECWHHCAEEMATVVWPKLRPLFVFTISPVGKFGTLFSYVGCLLAYFSFFTISYQVTTVCVCTTY